MLSRTQNVSDKRLDEALKLIREHCGENTSIITTPWDDLTGEQIYDVMCADGHKALLDAAELYEHEEHHHHHHDGETCSCGHHHHDHDEHEEHEHHHHDGETCSCGHHHHDHDEHEEHEHHHHDGETCSCGHHHHDHDEHEHHHEHHYDENGVCSCGHHHHGHDADEVFTSWGIETARKFTEDDLRARLNQLDDQELYGIVLRAKGIVPEQDGTWLHFDMVPGEIELRHGAADYTGRLCVIGSGIKEDALAALFA